MISGLSKATFLKRCKSAKLHLSSILPMQVDGEPWVQKPGSFEVSSSSMYVLQPTEGAISETISTMTDVLMWGQNKNIINSEQYSQLLKELTKRVALSNDYY